MKFIRSACACALLLSAPAVIAAQSLSTGNGNANTVGSLEQSDWLALQGLLQTLRRPVNTAAASVAGSEQARQKRIADLVSAADELKAFYGKYPTSSNAAEAKRQEALALIWAFAAGDHTQDARRQQLVASVRADASLPAEQRLEVAGYADNIAAERAAGPTRNEKLAAFERVARALALEFPSVPDCYAALVNIAKDADDAQAVKLATDIVAMPSAPDTVKAEAQIILKRHGLIGKALAAIVSPILGSENVVSNSAGKVVMVYAWRTSAPHALDRVKTAEQHLPVGSVAIGVCLDSGDLAAAKAAAAAQTLPGTQIFDALGKMGRLAAQLELTDPGLIYLADAKGVLRSVSAQHDVAAALASLPTS